MPVDRALWTEESSSEEDVVAPELNEEGSDRDTVDRVFMDPKRRFGLSFLMSFMAADREHTGGV